MPSDPKVLTDDLEIAAALKEILNAVAIPFTAEPNVTKTTFSFGNHAAYLAAFKIKEQLETLALSNFKAGSRIGTTLALNAQKFNPASVDKGMLEKMATKLFGPDRPADPDAFTIVIGDGQPGGTK